MAPSCNTNGFYQLGVPHSPCAGLCFGVLNPWTSKSLRALDRSAVEEREGACAPAFKRDPTVEMRWVSWEFMH